MCGVAWRPVIALGMLLWSADRFQGSSVGWLHEPRYPWATVVLSDAVISQRDKRADLGSLAAGYRVRPWAP